MFVLHEDDLCSLMMTSRPTIDLKCVLVALIVKLVARKASVVCVVSVLKHFLHCFSLIRTSRQGPLIPHMAGLDLLSLPPPHLPLSHRSPHFSPLRLPPHVFHFFFRSSPAHHFPPPHLHASPPPRIIAVSRRSLRPTEANGNCYDASWTIFSSLI